MESFFPLAPFPAMPTLGGHSEQEGSPFSAAVTTQVGSASRGSTCFKGKSPRLSLKRPWGQEGMGSRHRAAGAVLSASLPCGGL